jgi:hypothetical protein
MNKSTRIILIVSFVFLILGIISMMVLWNPSWGIHKTLAGLFSNEISAGVLYLSFVPPLFVILAAGFFVLIQPSLLRQKNVLWTIHHYAYMGINLILLFLFSIFGMLKFNEALNKQLTSGDPFSPAISEQQGDEYTPDTTTPKNLLEQLPDELKEQIGQQSQSEFDQLPSNLFETDDSPPNNEDQQTMTPTLGDPTEDPMNSDEYWEDLEAKFEEDWKDAEQQRQQEARGSQYQSPYDND